MFVNKQQAHTRTVVRECFKGDEASQWKRPNFGLSPHDNPSTDRGRRSEWRGQIFDRKFLNTRFCACAVKNIPKTRLCCCQIATIVVF